MVDEARQNLLNRLRISKDLEKSTDGALSENPHFDDIVSTIALLEHNKQEQIYGWAQAISRTNSELAAHFVNLVPSALTRMDNDGIQDWIDRALGEFDGRGLGAAIEVLDNFKHYARTYKNKRNECGFDDASVFLRHFVKGLGGREVRISQDTETYTDTDSIYLPDAVSLFEEPDSNFTMYKLTAAHLWAQTWYGTWRYQVVEKLIRHHELEKAIPIFNRLEALRLESCLKRDLPGLARELEKFENADAQARDLWDQWREAARPLLDKDATAEDSLNLASSFEALPLPPLQPYHGEMFAEKVREALFARVEREKAAFQKAMKDIRDQQEGDELASGGDESQKQMVEIEASDEDQGEGGDVTFQMSIDGETIELPEHLKDLMGSIMQDLGEIPEDYMEASDLGEYGDELLPQTGEKNANSETDLEESGTFTYKEWDCVRQRFRENFCTLRESTVPEADEAFVEQTLEKHRGILKSIKKTFEAVIGESRLQRRQSDGDSIDLDALIEAWADYSRGLEMSEYVYTKYRNQERNIAVMFMVDMSGSTLGWVNDAERESLVLLCEALEMLGDRYAIFGFSGRTNKRCEVYRVKEFADRYGSELKQRISGIRPKAYTRMGVAIRHLGQKLHETHARTKLLITLSDGRPEDYGGYKGKYGIEDTRHALLELKQAGIHAYCITIDNEAQEYLPHMYGPANYAVIDEVQKLPFKVADIYRRLTT